MIPISQLVYKETATVSERPLFADVHNFTLDKKIVHCLTLALILFSENKRVDWFCSSFLEAFKIFLPPLLSRVGLRDLIKNALNFSNPSESVQFFIELIQERQGQNIVS